MSFFLLLSHGQDATSAQCDLNLADELSTLVYSISLASHFRRFNQVALFRLLRHKSSGKMLLMVTSHLTPR